MDVRLRDVTDQDLPILYAQQLDPAATAMADFPARDHAAFVAHWAKIRGDPTVVIQAIEYDGQVAGNVLSFLMYDRREVGYWLGRDFWGLGIATRALTDFLGYEQRRPLFAATVPRNLGSLRVLEKCGFTVVERKTDEVLLTLP